MYLSLYLSALGLLGILNIVRGFLTVRGFVLLIGR